MDTFYYFATEAEIKTILSISNNVTIQSPLNQAIREAQESYIRTILCQDLYNDLMLKIKEADLINPVPIPLTPEYEALRQEIIPALSWWSLHEYLPFGAIRIREAAPASQNGQNITNVDIESITWLRQIASTNATRAELRLKNFLAKNSADYPLFSNCSCGCHSTKMVNRNFLYI